MGCSVPFCTPWLRTCAFSQTGDKWRGAADMRGWLTEAQQAPLFAVACLVTCLLVWRACAHAARACTDAVRVVFLLAATAAVGLALWYKLEDSPIACPTYVRS